MISNLEHIYLALGAVFGSSTLIGISLFTTFATLIVFSKAGFDAGVLALFLLTLSFLTYGLLPGWIIIIPIFAGAYLFLRMVSLVTSKQ